MCYKLIWKKHAMGVQEHSTRQISQSNKPMWFLLQQDLLLAEPATILAIQQLLSILLTTGQDKFVTFQ